MGSKYFVCMCIIFLNFAPIKSLVCTRPIQIGFIPSNDMTTENLNSDTFDGGTWECDERNGYVLGSGTISTAACTSNGPYTVSGNCVMSTTEYQCPASMSSANSIEGGVYILTTKIEECHNNIKNLDGNFVIIGNQNEWKFTLSSAQSMIENIGVVVTQGTDDNKLTNAVTSNNELIFASAHGFLANTAVVYTDNSVTAIAPLVDGTMYYVLTGTTTSTMKLAATSGGSAITIANGQGAAGNKITKTTTGTLKKALVGLTPNIVVQANSAADIFVTTKNLKIGLSVDVAFGDISTAISGVAEIQGKTNYFSSDTNHGLNRKFLSTIEPNEYAVTLKYLIISNWKSSGNTGQFGLVIRLNSPAPALFEHVTFLNNGADGDEDTGTRTGDSKNAFVPGACEPENTNTACSSITAPANQADCDPQSVGTCAAWAGGSGTECTDVDDGPKATCTGTIDNTRIQKYSGKIFGEQCAWTSTNVCQYVAKFNRCAAGGVMETGVASNVEIRDSTFKNNKCLNDPSATVLKANDRDSTTKDGYGGALVLKGQTKIYRTEFVGNSAKGGGAIYNAGQAYIEGSTFRSNAARGKFKPASTDGGGAIYNKGSLTCQECNFKDNTAADFTATQSNGKFIVRGGGWHWLNIGSLKLIGTGIFDPPASQTTENHQYSGADKAEPNGYNGRLQGCGKICYETALSFHSCANDPHSMYEGVICRKCVVGKKGKSDGDGCTDCSIGKYQDEEGLPFCINCPAGYKQSQAGQAYCASCDVGQYSSYDDGTGIKQCSDAVAGEYVGENAATYSTKCPLGTSNNQKQQSSCPSCNAGFYSAAAGARTCDPVTVGKYADTTKSVLIGCTKGSYVATTEETTCTLCPVGYHQDEDEKNHCKQCNTGKYASGEGSITCIFCVAGKYSDQLGATNCKNCQLGRFAAGNANAGATTCDPVTVGKYADTTKSVLIGCTKGSYVATTEETTCTLCPVGYHQDDDEKNDCKQCNTGTHASGEGSIKCISCVAGKYSDQLGATNCKNCQLGRFAAEKANTCIVGAAGKYVSDGQTSMVSCSAGKFSLGTTSDCSECPRGWNQNASGMVLCHRCMPGKGAELSGMAQCTSCSQGQYSNGGVAKYYETTNQVIDLGTSVCTTCPVDYINTVEGAGFCTPCDKSNRQTTLGREGQSICVIEDPLTLSKPTTPYAIEVMDYIPLEMHTTMNEINESIVKHDDDVEIANRYQRELSRTHWPRYVNMTWQYQPRWSKTIYNNVTGQTTTTTNFLRPKVEFVVYWSTLKDMSTRYGPFRASTTSILLDMQRNIKRGSICPIDAKLLDGSPNEKCLATSVDVRKESIYTQVYVSLNTYDFVELISPVSLPWLPASTCNDKSYLNTTSIHPTEWQCATCPLGASCEGQIAWPEVTSKMGWWRNPVLANRTEPAPNSVIKNTLLFAPCLFPPSCQGAMNVDEFHGKYSESKTNQSTTLVYQIDPSHVTRKEECDPTAYVSGKRLCGTCQPNYIMDEDKGMMCVKCPEPGNNIALFVLGLFLATLLISVLLALRIRSHGHKHLSGVLKRVILNYLQVSSLALKFNLVWPESMNWLLSTEGSIATVSSKFVHPDCLLRGMYTNRTMALLDLEKGVVWSQFEVVTCRQVINIMTALLLPAIVTTVVIFRGLVCQKRGLDIHPHAIHPHHSKRKRRKRKSRPSPEQFDSPDMMSNPMRSKGKKDNKTEKDKISDTTTAAVTTITINTTATTATENIKKMGVTVPNKSRNSYFRRGHRHKKTKEEKDNELVLDEDHMLDGISFHQEDGEDQEEFESLRDSANASGEIESSEFESLPLPSVRDDAVVSMIFTLYLLYPTLCSGSFDMLRCTSVFGKSYLNLDLEIPCYDWKDGRHISWVLISTVPQILVFAIGLPILAMVVIWRYKRKGLLDDHYTHLQIGTLYDGYRVEDRWYWEGVLALRKLAMVSVTMLASSLHQAMAAVLVLLIALVLNEVFRPFDEERQNYRWALLRWLDLSSICANIAIMWCGVLVASEQQQMAARGGNITFGTDILVWICAIANVLVFTFGLWKFFYETYREKLHLIKIVATPFDHMTKAQQLKVLNLAMGSATKTTDSGIDGNDNDGYKSIFKGNFDSMNSIVKKTNTDGDTENGDIEMKDMDSNVKERRGTAVLKRCEAYVTI